MQEIWSIFKFFETAGGLSCIAFHVYGFLRKAIDYDHVIYSAIFFSGTFITMLTHLHICMGFCIRPISEALLNFCLGTAFLYASLLTMYHAEDEYDILFFQRLGTNRIVETFKFTKAQSLGALVTGTFHILHCFLASDAYLSNAGEEDDIPDDETGGPTGPLKMFVGSRAIHLWLLQFRCFRDLSRMRIEKTGSLD